MPPSRVWLMRHAETTAPALFHGADSDVALSRLGERQSDAAAEFFRPRGVTGVVSSGLRRALDTATPIAAACGVAVGVEPMLHERRLGALSGQPFDLPGSEWPETVRRWQAGETGYSPEGAESFDALVARLLPAWTRSLDAHPGGRVVVVAHGIVCKVLLLTLLDGYGPGAWGRLGRVANMSVSELEPTAGGGWRAVSLLQVPAEVSALTGGEETGVGLPAPPA